MTSSHTRTLFHLLAICLLAAAPLGAQPAPAAQPAPPAAAQPAEPEAPKHRLRQIVVVEGVDPAQQPGPGPGFLVLAPAFASFDAAELLKRLVDGENQPMEPKLITAIGQVVENYARQQNYPHALATIPNQNIAEGRLTVVLMLHPPLIRQIVIGASPEDAQQLAATSAGSGYLVLSPAFAHLPRAELATRLAPGENQPLQEKLAAAIAQVVEVFFKQNDFLAAQAVIPPQNATDGILRVAVHLGKIRNIKVAGNHWFSESLLREKLKIEQGEILRLSELDRAVTWTNNSPFRRIQVKVDPVATTGEADLIIAVQDAIPFRAQLSYDSGGNDLVGKHRFTAAATYANLWGRDHQVSYQLITTDLGLKVYQGHGLDYRLPLPWRDTVQISASYLKLAPSIISGLLDQEGKNINASLRYSHPLRTDNPAEVYAGLEFKQSNNNLLFYVDETTRVPAVTNATDVFQFTTGGSMIRRDKRGAWAFGANLNFSPGRVNSRNSESAFHSSRPFSNPRYFYGQLTFQRLVNLSHGWDFMARGVGQYSHHNLLSSEELYVGGSSTVRGYRENVFGGDSGYFLSTELLSPTIKRKIGRLPQNRDTLETRFVGFFDTGRVRVHLPTNLDPPVSSLASLGLGVRMNLGTNFFLTADYGWQLTYLPYKVDQPRRGHVKATLAF